MKRQIIVLCIWAVLSATSVVLAGEKPPAAPTAKDKCPVCGMFVARYASFATQIIFKDGFRAFFDGPKDMFKYYLKLSEKGAARKVGDIDGIYVTDYYDLKWTDGYQAFYVQGSDVYGPMGRELISFEKEAGAKRFVIDHAGKSVFRFDEITLDVIKALD